MQDKKKRYTTCNIKRADFARRFQNITGHLINLILNAVDNNILQNLPILWDDVRMDENIYGPSIPYLKGNIVRRKIQHVEPVKITIPPKTIMDKYKEVTLCCDLIHIRVINLFNTIWRHIMFATVSMIKNWKIENIADWITQVHKLYLQHGFKITHIRTDCEFELLRKDITAISINLNCASKK